MLLWEKVAAGSNQHIQHISDVVARQLDKQFSDRLGVFDSCFLAAQQVGNSQVIGTLAEFDLRWCSGCVGFGAELHCR